MSAGRTTWWPCDAAEHDRELNVELGEEFGAEGPYLMRVLKDLAQAQRAEGLVRTGFRVLRQKTFVATPGRVRAIVEHAAEIGALDDLAIDEDGRRFTCRVSGWADDQARGREAIKKAGQRSRSTTDSVPTDGDLVPAEGDTSTSEGDVSGSVPPTRHNQTKENNNPLPPSKGEGVEDRLPEDLPSQLYAGALAAHAALTRIAAAKPAARPVTLAAVGRVVASFPTHDHAQVAGDVEHWWLHGQGSTKTMKDVVMTYRNRLTSLPTPPAAPAATVHRLPETPEQRRARIVREAEAHNARVIERSRGVRS